MYIEKIHTLFHKAPSEIDDVIDYSMQMVSYVNSVINHQLQQERNRLYLISGRIDQQEYIQKIEALNDNRNQAHDKACLACHNINVIAERHHMPKIFDFELEMIKDRNGITKGASQNNHYFVSQFCAQFVNEYYEKGTKEYNVNIMDDIANRDKPYNVKELSKMETVANEWINHLSESKIAPYIEAGQKDIRLQDDVNIHIVKNNMDYSVDVQIAGKGCIDDISPDNAFFFDKNGYGQDVPISVIQEIVLEHGGINHEVTREIAKQEQTVNKEELSFEEKLEQLSQEQDFEDKQPIPQKDMER